MRDSPNYPFTTYRELDLFGFVIKLASLHGVEIDVYSDRIDAWSDETMQLNKIKHDFPCGPSFMRKVSAGKGKTYCLTVYHRILWNHKREYLSELPRPP